MTDEPHRPTIRSPYEIDAGEELLHGTGGQWSERRLAQLQRPFLAGVAHFQRHLRHPGRLVVRSVGRGRHQAIVAYRPHDGNLPTALFRSTKVTLMLGFQVVHFEVPDADAALSFWFEGFKFIGSDEFAPRWEACIDSEQIVSSSWRMPCPDDG